MYWVGLVGILALIFFISSVLLFLWGRRRVEPLPDGDYVVTIIGTKETPLGAATMYRVDEPEAFQGRTVTVVKGHG